MKTARTATASVLLAVVAGLAALGVVFHYGLTVEYGDITHSPLEGLWAGFVYGTGTIALALVALAAVAAGWVSPRSWMRLTAVAIPALMVLGMLAVTPAALQKKLEVAYDATPQCVSSEGAGSSPGSRAARESQQAFESIEHVGHFGGGGGSGVGGCDRPFVLTADVDVLGHYRTTLPGAGWQVVEDDGRRLRAERDGMAFEVFMCGRGGVVWAGSADDRGSGAASLSDARPSVGGCG